jgi:hypothetical protein
MITPRMLSSSIQSEMRKERALEGMVPGVDRCLFVRQAEAASAEAQTPRRSRWNNDGRLAVMLRYSRPCGIGIYGYAAVIGSDHYHLSGWRWRCPFANHTLDME